METRKRWRPKCLGEAGGLTSCWKALWDRHEVCYGFCFVASPVGRSHPVLGTKGSKATRKCRGMPMEKGKMIILGMLVSFLCLTGRQAFWSCSGVAFVFPASPTRPSEKRRVKKGSGLISPFGKCLV